MQVRRPQSVHVRMPRRWGDKAFLLVAFISPLSSDGGGYDAFFPLSQVMRTAPRQKTCLSTRGKSPTTLCSPPPGPGPTAGLAARPQRLLRLRGEVGCFQEPGTLATTVRENTCPSFFLLEMFKSTEASVPKRHQQRENDEGLTAQHVLVFTIK